MVQKHWSRLGDLLIPFEVKYRGAHDGALDELAQLFVGGLGDELKFDRKAAAFLDFFDGRESLCKSLSPRISQQKSGAGDQWN